VVVVSYNTRELTRRCLQSVLAAGSDARMEAILVDNASSDGSAEMVKDEFPAVRLIASPDNLGFAAGNNRGFALATGEFVMLLNPDTELRPGALRSLLAFARANPRVGVVGPRVYLPSGAQQSTTIRFPRLGDVFLNLLLPSRWVRRSRRLNRARYAELDLDRVQEVEAIAGCCMLVPRDLIDEVGGMDERFFMYGEEVEWCHRIRQAGWSIVYHPGAEILHHAGQSAKQRPDSMAVAMARGQLRVIAVLHGSRAAALANAVMALRDLPRASIWWATGMVPRLRTTRLARLLRPAAVRLPFHLRWMLRPDWTR
jgi:hypothetical protein